MDAAVKLAIVGSVKLAGNRDAQAIIELVLDAHRPEWVVSGGAAGVDSMAEQEAIRRGIQVLIYRPSQQTWKKFKERNLRIAESCDRLVRIVARHSKTYGSGWTRDRAAEMGKPTEEYIVDLPC